VKCRYLVCIRERDGKKSRREREEILFHSLTHNSHTLVQMSVRVKIKLRRSHDQSYDFKNTEREVTCLALPLCFLIYI